MNDIIDELLELKSEWAGPNTRSPSVWMIENVRTVANRNLQYARAPDEIEVDPDDGSITLHWTRKDCGQSFALAFQTRSKVIGVLTDLFQKTGYPPWRIPIEDSDAIREKLAHPTVNNLLTTIEKEGINK